MRRAKRRRHNGGWSGASSGWTARSDRRSQRGWLLRLGLMLAIAVLTIGAVPAARRLALVSTAKAILVLASPTEPEVVDLRALDAVSTLLAADGSVLTELGGDERRRPVAIADVPDHVVDAVLAAEDANFYEHEGVDPTGIFRALLRTSTGRTEGGSTISQQLAKLNFTTGERTFSRKFKEVQYVRRLERTYSKDQLLERYLNQVYFGERSYGLRAAAQTFFAVEPAQLTVSQAAFLAGKIRAPEGIDPRSDPDAARARRNQVLRSMRKREMITAPVLEREVERPLDLAPPSATPPTIAPDFVAYVEREAARLEELGPDATTRSARLATGGLRIQTTFDRATFEATVAAVRSTLGEPDDPTTAVASVEPGTGAVQSLFGGLDERSTFDPSSQGGRQPGSAFKPFVYLAALEAGIDPRSTFDGRSDQVFPCYGPTPVSNYAGESADGGVDLDEAMARSVNVTFVEVGCLVGVAEVLDVAERAGIPSTATDPVPATFLGGLSKGVTALEMAAAYATFASGGLYAKPFAIEEIADAEGRSIYEHDVDAVRVFDERHVGILNAALQRVVARGTARAAAIGRDVAGKTGTTTDNLDAWFVGYVPQLSTAVRVGFEPARPMRDVRGRAVTGGSFPARVFSLAMTAALEGRELRILPVARPDGLSLTLLTTTTTTTSTTTTTIATEPTDTTSTASTTAPDTSPPATSPPSTGAPTTTAPTTTASG